MGSIDDGDGGEDGQDVRTSRLVLRASNQLRLGTDVCIVVAVCAVPRGSLPCPPRTLLPLLLILRLGCAWFVVGVVTGAAVSLALRWAARGAMRPCDSHQLRSSGLSGTASTAPGCRSPSEYGPNAMRISRLTCQFMCPNTRRSSRFLPSVSVASTHVLERSRFSTTSRIGRYLTPSTVMPCASASIFCCVTCTYVAVHAHGTRALRHCHDLERSIRGRPRTKPWILALYLRSNSEAGCSR